MDLSASLQKLNREKRERQPNWTEAEKQLLLCLTGMHRSILENKGSDTMTIKRKSEAWDQIALRMKAAGFNRSKDRLKQQLGRIRAAEAKKVKDTMENNVNVEQIKILHNLNTSIEENMKTLKLNFNNNASSLPRQEQQFIKSENVTSIGIDDCIEQEVNSTNFTKPNIINYDMKAATEHKNNEHSKIFLDSMHFKLQSVESLAKINKIVDTEANLRDCFIEERSICATDVTSSVSCSNLSSSIPLSTSYESNPNNSNGSNEYEIVPTTIGSSQRNDCEIRPRNVDSADCYNNNEYASSLTAGKPPNQQPRRRRVHSRSNCKRSSFNREQTLRQLYNFRIAIERERLRNLKLQQKRDRILYRKDVEIQNLKLQILKNLANQQRDASTLNF